VRVPVENLVGEENRAAGTRRAGPVLRAGQHPLDRPHRGDADVPRKWRAFSALSSSSRRHMAPTAAENGFARIAA
jgi:hypothetical protein